MKESDHFEIQIKRIKELLEEPGAKIIWNDKVSDPDNPKQSRQVDITISNHNLMTHVECRFHKKKQDVKWIEELLGRKMSLGADRMIAVSFSGFTKGAKKKAEKWGIFLRDLYELTEDEIKDWGNNSTMLLGLYRYENIVLTLLFDIGLANKFDPIKIINEIPKLDYMYDWVEYVKDKLHKKMGKSKKINKFEQLIYFKPGQFEINDIPLTGVIVKADINQEDLVIKNSSVLVYDEPSVASELRKTRIDKFGFDGFEITKANGKVSICINLLTVDFPENCQFNGRLILNQEIRHDIGDIRIISLNQDHMKFKKVIFQMELIPAPVIEPSYLFTKENRDPVEVVLGNVKRGSKSINKS